MSTLVRKELLDLGVAIQANLVGAGLSDEVVDYFLANKQKIRDALRRGFSPYALLVNSQGADPGLIGSFDESLQMSRQFAEKYAGQINLSDFMKRRLEINGGLNKGADSVENAVSFRIAETDLLENLKRAEAFILRYFDVGIYLAEHSVLPEYLPWKSVLPVFIPAGVDNLKAFRVLSDVTGNPSFMDYGYIQYPGCESSSESRLYLIANRLMPDKDTMGLSTDELIKKGASWLSLKGYVLAMSLRFTHDTCRLDPQGDTCRSTLTWFPGEGETAECCSFFGNATGFERPKGSNVFAWGGARLAIPVPLRLK
jgi:hypothetical protein